MKPAEVESLSSLNRLERISLDEGEEEAMPLPADPKVIFLGGIFLILLLAALYITAEIVWPLVFAFALSLLLNPLLRFLASLHVPRVLGALILVTAVLLLVVALGTAMQPIRRFGFDAAILFSEHPGRSACARSMRKLRGGRRPR
jgi:hypothetical protein